MTRRLPVDLWPFELIGWLRDMAEAATDWCYNPRCRCGIRSADLDAHNRRFHSDDDTYRSRP